MSEAGASPPALRRSGLLLGLAGFAFILIAPLPEGLGHDGRSVLACAALMAVWWMTEALPIPLTSLLPVLLFPLLGIMPMQQATSPYADQLVFLFLGGFIMALAVERSALHRRIALTVIDAVGSGPRALVLGFMIATAGLSMWISNTAAVMLMLPIATAVIDHRRRDDPNIAQTRFPVALLLGVAYAASIGGVGTLIGTPPNIVLAGVLRKLYPEAPAIGFLQWMLFGLPLVFIFLPVCWFLLVRVLPFTRITRTNVETNSNALREERDALGSMTMHERTALGVFISTGTAWVFRAPMELGVVRIPGITDLLPWVSDATIAIAAAFALFLLSSGMKSSLLRWKDVQHGIPWGILLLFGGGFALAEGMRSTGVTLFLGAWITHLDTLPLILLIVSVCLLLTFLTEITSNTATANILLPLLSAAAVTLGQHPLLLALPAALSASFAFMLPVATPPNAIVFASSYIGIRQMAGTGLVLNLLGVVLVSMTMYALGLVVFDITLDVTPAWVR